jgi:hypothetical protein
MEPGRGHTSNANHQNPAVSTLRRHQKKLLAIRYWLLEKTKRTAKSQKLFTAGGAMGKSDLKDCVCGIHHRSVQKTIV